MACFSHSAPLEAWRVSRQCGRDGGSRKRCPAAPALLLIPSYYCVPIKSGVAGRMRLLQPFRARHTPRIRWDSIPSRSALGISCPSASKLAPARLGLGRASTMEVGGLRQRFTMPGAILSGEQTGTARGVDGQSALAPDGMRNTPR